MTIGQILDRLKSDVGDHYQTQLMMTNLGRGIIAETIVNTKYGYQVLLPYDIMAIRKGKFGEDDMKRILKGEMK